MRVSHRLPVCINRRAVPQTLFLRIGVDEWENKTLLRAIIDRSSAALSRRREYA
jgi:hypothetical protein